MGRPADFWKLAVPVVLFAGGMIAMEVLIEALFQVPDLPRTIALWTTTSQFTCCALLPLLRERNLHSLLSEDSKGLLQAWGPYAVLASVQFLSNAAASHAVHFVENNLKVICKATKLLPAMLVATCMGNARKYSPTEYLAALLLCTGTAIFSFSSGKDSSGAANAYDTLFGMALLVFAVVADATIPNAQQRLMQGGASAAKLMFRLNLLGAVGGCLGLLVSGDAFRLHTYFHDHFRVVAMIVGVGISLAIAVMAYTHIIKECGTVVAVSISTLRKTVTVVLSYILFPGKKFDWHSAMGLAFVGAGIVLAEWMSASVSSRTSARKSAELANSDVEIGRREAK